ncbi:MAG: hypothetical protein H6862_07480 [Rhodospirillales bacterium]|nr:hypothetical protein [Rhodospirillales bacterium]
MGKLTSVPKAPPSPTYIYVPAPPVSDVATTSSGATSTDTSGTTSTAPSDAETEAAKAARRVAGILNARRGRISTILTSFRGFLDPASASPTRKTLLGE